MSPNKKNSAREDVPSVSRRVRRKLEVEDRQNNSSKAKQPKSAKKAKPNSNKTKAVGETTKEVSLSLRRSNRRSSDPSTSTVDQDEPSSSHVTSCSRSTSSRKRQLNELAAKLKSTDRDLIQTYIDEEKGVFDHDSEQERNESNEVGEALGGSKDADEESDQEEKEVSEVRLPLTKEPAVINESDDEQEIPCSRNSSSVLDITGDDVEEEPSIQDQDQEPEDNHSLLNPPRTQPNEDMRTERTTRTQYREQSRFERSTRTQRNAQMRPDPSIVEERCPDNGKTDEALVENVIRSVKEQIVSDVKSAVVAFFADEKVGKMEAALGRMNDRLEHLTSVVTTTAAMTFNKNGVSIPKQKEIQQALCILPALFSEKFICKIVLKCFVGRAFQQVTNGRLREQEKTGFTLLSILMFSKKSNETRKKKFASEVGREYSGFRHGVLLSAFIVLQNNRFNTFLSEAEEKAAKIANIDMSANVQNVSTEGQFFNCKIIQPRWLKVGYITTEHCEEAASKAEHRTTENRTGDEASSWASTGDSESIQGSQVNATQEVNTKVGPQSSSRSKQSKKVPITNDLIAVEAASMVYRIITNVLHKGRDSCKVQMYHEMLYLFSGWSQFGSCVSQSSLHLKWFQQSSESVQYLNSVPLMKEIKPQERIPSRMLSNDSIDNENVKRLSQIISEHPEMSIVVHHDVKVKGTAMRLRYHINMLEVASKVVGSYGTLVTNSQSKDVLSVDQGSLKVIIVIALALRKLVDCTLKDIKDGEQVPWARNSTLSQKPGQKGQDEVINQYTFPEVDGISLNHFQPPRSKQKEILGPMILNLKQEEYEMKNEPSFPQDFTNDGGPNLGNPVDESALNARPSTSTIRADTSNGVFSF